MVRLCAEFDAPVADVAGADPGAGKWTFGYAVDEVLPAADEEMPPLVVTPVSVEIPPLAFVVVGSNGPEGEPGPPAGRADRGDVSLAASAAGSVVSPLEADRFEGAARYEPEPAAEALSEDVFCDAGAAGVAAEPLPVDEPETDCA